MKKQCIMCGTKGKVREVFDGNFKWEPEDEVGITQQRVGFGINSKLAFICATCWPKHSEDQKLHREKAKKGEEEWAALQRLKK